MRFKVDPVSRYCRWPEAEGPQLALKCQWADVGCGGKGTAWMDRDIDGRGYAEPELVTLARAVTVDERFVPLAAIRCQLVGDPATLADQVRSWW